MTSVLLAVWAWSGFPPALAPAAPEARPDPGTRPACVEVAEERITAADLAAVEPAWRQVPPGWVAGFAPLPGRTRWVHEAEVRRWMRKAGLDGAAAGRVCIVRLGSAVAPAQVREAVRLAVAAEQREGRRMEWEVLDYDHTPLPRGELKFARGPISASPPNRPAGVSLWPGRWIYDAGRKSSPFWVRIRIVCRERRVVLARALPARALLSAADLKLEADSACAAEPPPLRGLDAAVDRRLRRSLPAGARLTAACFEPRYLVERGQTVRFEAEVAGARVSFTGTANTSGGLGDKVSIRPLSRGRLLWGRVSGLATVTTTGTIAP